MSAGVKWKGLDELRATLKNLPERLADGAGEIVLGHARAAFDEIYNAYPVRTGNLRKQLRLDEEDIGKYGVFVRLRNTAKHAYIFERGTVARHNRYGSTGIMPPGRVFLPIAIRRRHRMYDALVLFLEGEGLRVRRRD